MSNRPAADRLITKLITVLSEEMQMYNELLLVLRKKQSSIIEGKIEELNQAIQKEQAILRRSETLAKTREASFMQVGEALEQEEEIRTIGQLIELVESTYAERLSDIHGSLQRILQEVTLVNEENRYLLNFSIKFVREAARELVKSSELFPVYSATGREQEIPIPNRLIEGKI
ncbi:MAG: flagellar protein FlgN [Candidatus Marinimicrobia bacterium]|nr:flagellar protein FlgN [Candidatus Neomarinimicrobiota bacterium]